MLNIIAEEGWGANTLGSWFAAQRAADEAVRALEDAGAGLLPLVEASDWQADGVRALHALIIDLRTRVASETGVLGGLQREIESAGLS